MRDFYKIVVCICRILIGNKYFSNKNKNWLMFKKETQSPLLKSTREALQNEVSLSDLSNPLQQYNYFVEFYNKKENCINGLQLDSLSSPNSTIFNHFWKVYSNSFLLLVFLLLMLVPFAGIFLYLTLCISLVTYFLALQTFKRNENKVENPFERMIFCPEMCTSVGLPNKFYEIRIEGSFFF